MIRKDVVFHDTFKRARVSLFVTPYTARKGGLCFGIPSKESRGREATECDSVFNGDGLQPLTNRFNSIVLQTSVALHRNSFQILFCQ